MKKVLTILCAGVLASLLCVACGNNGGEPTPPEPQEIPVVLTDASKYDNYYVSNGHKIELTKTDGMSYIVFNNSDTQTITNKITALGAIIEQLAPISMPNLENPDGYLLNCSRAVVSAGYDDMSKITELIYVTPFCIFHYEQMDEEKGITHDLYVILKSESDLAKLKKLAEDNKLLFIGKHRSDKQYRLACTKESTGNTLQIANWLNELNMFESAYPDMLINVYPAK